MSVARVSRLSVLRLASITALAGTGGLASGASMSKPLRLSARVVRPGESPGFCLGIGRALGLGRGGSVARAVRARERLLLA